MKSDSELLRAVVRCQMSLVAVRRKLCVSACGATQRVIIA